MSYTYLQERGGVSSVESFSGIPVYVLSRLNLTAEMSCCSDKETGFSHGSQYGMMCEHSTEPHGAEKSISCAEASLAKTLASEIQPEKVSTETGLDCGVNFHASLARFDRTMLCWKTHQASLFGERQECLRTWPQWGMWDETGCWELPMLEGITNDFDSGVLPIPTTTRSEYKGCVKSRFRGSPFYRGTKMCEGLRTSEKDPAYLNPSFGELAMGWPIGWTDLKPLAMDRFRNAWLLPGLSFVKELRNEK